MRTNVLSPPPPCAIRYKLRRSNLTLLNRVENSKRYNKARFHHNNNGEMFQVFFPAHGDSIFSLFYKKFWRCFWHTGTRRGKACNGNWIIKSKDHDTSSNTSEITAKGSFQCYGIEPGTNTSLILILINQCLYRRKTNWEV